MRYFHLIEDLVIGIPQLRHLIWTLKLTEKAFALGIIGLWGY